MSAGRLNSVLGRFAVTLREHAEADGQVLERFVRHRDEAAFASLVRRHGPMVFGVCRRLLRHEQDAEDAFQATFLVLAKKAPSVRPRDRVGNWLYGVAYRTAKDARRAAARRRAREAQAVPRAEVTEGVAEDLRAVLDQAVASLPTKYREVIVLCDLQDQARKEVAQQLGCPEGTVASRLARARAVLARRLAGRGLTLAACPLAVLPREAASAALVEATVNAAGAAGVVPASVAALAEGVLRAMLWTKLKAATVVLLLLALVAVSYGLLTP